MIRQYELVERVAKYNPAVNEALLNRAYVYAMKAHGSQKRASGDLFFTHPLEVAAILTELRLDDATIVAALLHDTIEDTDVTRDEIDALFGHEIGRLVEGLTKIKKLDLVSRKAEQAENFRKLLLAISDDVRILLVKLADRLHNMRTLGSMPKRKRQRIAEETMDIYAPLAGRMGMHGIREELEDLSFRELSPEGYPMVSGKLAAVRERNQGFIDQIKDELIRRLAESGIEAKVRGREKRPYSIWRKMERKSISFEQLSDIYGFRVIVATKEECYRAVGVVHMTWPMVPGRFKDYISTPKLNDYSSLHTTVIGPGHQRVELQIRTQEMHNIAEYGIAAHSLYKDFGSQEAPLAANGKGGGRKRAGGRGNGKATRVLVQETNAYQWLHHLLELLEEGDNPEEFLEHTKLELFQDQVFCFTPKGRLIALPRGATPIDFAYAVHTDVGNTCVGCKINGRISPLVSELANGDEVEIICSKTQTPPAAWESIAVTGKARARIRRASREAVREQYAGLGRQILKRTFERVGKTFSEDGLAAVLNRLARSSVGEVLAAVGRGEMPSEHVLHAVYPDHKDSRAAEIGPPNREEGWFGLKRAIGLKFKVPGTRSEPAKDAEKPSRRGKAAKDSAIPIRGLKGDLPVRFAPGSGAVPGDRIIGILTPGEGITIYPINSPALKEFDEQPELWLDTRWDIDPENPERFPARVRVVAINEPGALAMICQVIGDHDGNIDNMKISARSHDYREMVIDLEVWDAKHLNAIISQLRKKPNINLAERVIE
ncbi:MAG: bifunctional (p)ppGpp synthetase/guanosine-3',5'-bis(diphosphate) 3'-pyrophosphohydrolase [Rhodobiaceae bacterium]|nr:bifunctional (p)ppGpp synthetase/guanosine-3',5'-bis(diphosphate) 3'-pyrophosphohydrolase [Rhodobiaceae bacterium]